MLACSEAHIFDGRQSGSGSVCPLYDGIVRVEWRSIQTNTANILTPQKRRNTKKIK
jgi:hypothetical protein